MQSKSFQQFPSTIICIAASESVFVIQRKYTIGHRCKTVQHLPAKSNTQHDAKSSKGASFYLHTVIWCCNMLVMLRSTRLQISPPQQFKPNILMRNLLLMKKYKMHSLPRTNSSEQTNANISMPIMDACNFDQVCFFRLDYSIWILLKKNEYTMVFYV